MHRGNGAAVPRDETCADDGGPLVGHRRHGHLAALAGQAVDDALRVGDVVAGGHRELRPGDLILAGRLRRLLCRVQRVARVHVADGDAEEPEQLPALPGRHRAAAAGARFRPTIADRRRHIRRTAERGDTAAFEPRHLIAEPLDTLELACRVHDRRARGSTLGDAFETALAKSLVGPAQRRVDEVDGAVDLEHRRDCQPLQLGDRHRLSRPVLRPGQPGELEDRLDPAARPAAREAEDPRQEDDFRQALPSCISFGSESRTGTARPRSTILPSVGGVSPARISTSVDLPELGGPTIPVDEPARSSRSISRKIQPAARSSSSTSSSSSSSSSSGVSTAAMRARMRPPRPAP